MNGLINRRRVLGGGGNEEIPLDSTEGFEFGVRYNTIGKVASEECCITCKYKVNSGDVIRYNVRYDGVNLYVWAFDDNDNGTCLGATNIADRTITIPEGCVKVSFSLNSNKLDECYIYNVTTEKYLYKGKNAS